MESNCKYIQDMFSVEQEGKDKLSLEEEKQK